MMSCRGAGTAGCLSESRAPCCPTGIFPAPGTFTATAAVDFKDPRLRHVVSYESALQATWSTQREGQLIFSMPCFKGRRDRGHW